MVGRAATRRWVLHALALAAAGAVSRAAPAAAQLARFTQSPPDAPKMLVTVFNRDNPDSSIAVTIADGLRDRMRFAHAQRFNPIAKPIMNENLVASGFPPDMPLDASVWRQLARFVNARIVIEGWIVRKPGDSALVTARLAESSGSVPQSATASVMVSLSHANGSTGSDLANRLADAHRSFEHVRTCRAAVDSLTGTRGGADSTRLLNRAQQAVARALEQYPSSANAHLCVGMIRRAQHAPADSVLAALQRAEAADSLNSLVLRSLAVSYDERGDTTNLLRELHNILKIELTNDTLRVNTARIFVQKGMADSAVTLIEEGLARSPSNVMLLSARSVALAAARRWADAAATLSQVAEVDSANVDSLFVLRITQYYQAIPDTAKLLLWTRIATLRLPAQASYLYSLSTLLAARGDTAGATDAVRRYLTARPSDSRAALALAVFHSGAGRNDSALVWAQKAATNDSTLRPQAAALILGAGRAAFQDTTVPGPVRFQRADSILAIAQPWATRQTLAYVGYIRALSELQLAANVLQDAQANRSCDAVKRAGDLLTAAEPNIIVGVSVNRDQANQILSQYIPQYRQNVASLQRQFHCQ